MFALSKQKIFFGTFWILLLFLAVAAGTGYSEASARQQRSGSDDIAAIEKLQKEYFENIKTKNLKKTAEMLDDKYQGIYALGTIDKQRELKDLESFSRILDEYAITDEKINLPNSTTAIVTFRLSVTVNINGKKISEQDNVLTVWIKKNKKWQMISQAAVKITNS